jgi:hypothetical protein
MSEFKTNNVISYLCVGIMGLVMISKNYPLNIRAAVTNSIINQADDRKQSKSSPLALTGEAVTHGLDRTSLRNRPLKLTLSVDNPAFLKVKLGEKIKQGDVISDNSLERSRLDKQRKSLLLQIDNLKAKTIPKPTEPKKPPASFPLPEANYMQETSAIAMAQLKLQQAQATLLRRTPELQTDNPEKRADMENAESVMQQAQEKVKEQEEMLKNMQDMRLDTPIIRHEQAKLKQIQSNMKQAQSLLEREKAKLNASAIASSQDLQNLKMAVQIAESDLQMAQSKLVTAKSNRKLLEYRASIEAAQRIEQENQFLINYSQQQQQYAQNLREKDYQLAQLQIQLSAIDDKLAIIPMVRSPQDGYIKKIKPWTGNNGKYTTIITIASHNNPKPIAGKGSNQAFSSPTPDSTKR